MECGVKLLKHPVVVVVSYDSFRYDYVNKTSIPNLDRIKNAGVTVPYIIDQFISQHSPVTALATWWTVELHGIVGNSLYGPVDNVLMGKEEATAREFWDFKPARVTPLWVMR